MKAIIDNPRTLTTLKPVEVTTAELGGADRGPRLHPASAVVGSLMGIWHSSSHFHQLLRYSRP